MAGLGDRATGLMSMLFGGDEEQEQATHTMPDGTVMPGASHSGGGDTGNGMGMGLGNVMTNVSNQMFKGMSREQVYKMGQSFNTLRFEPDDRMAANFESRLAAMDKDKSSKAARTNAVNALLNMKSEAYPNGRVDLADLVRQGVYSSADAIKEALKKPTVSKTQELLGIFNDESNPYNLTDAQRQLGTENALGVSITKGDLEKKTDLYTKMKGEADAAGTVMSPNMLEMFGISKENQSKFDEDWNNLSRFAEDNGMKPAELQEKRLALITGVQPDDGKTEAIKTMEFRAEAAGLKPGTPDYQEFFLNYGGGQGVEVNVDLADPGDNQDKYRDKIQTLTAEEDIADIKAMQAAKKAIVKLDRILDVIQNGDPNLGALQGLKQRADELLAKFTNSKEAYASATDTQVLEALLGSDVFGMIAILGIGARGIDTPAERDFLIRVMTGEQKMTKAALEEMTYYRRKYSRQVLDDYNEKLGNGYYDNYQLYSKKTLKAVPVTALTPYAPPLLADTISIDRANELLLKYPTQQSNQ
tara:strand:- start:464 stop:2050 length:1587 start_codon:yes stop_codon:yes gene_type:complete